MCVYLCVCCTFADKMSGDQGVGCSYSELSALIYCMAIEKGDQ